MDAASLEALLEHGVAELRGAFPHIASCERALVEWSEEGQARYSLALDIRWRDHQSLVCGPAEASPAAAAAAAFALAHERLAAAPPPR